MSGLSERDRQILQSAQTAAEQRLGIKRSKEDVPVHLALNTSFKWVWSNSNFSRSLFSK